MKGYFEAFFEQAPPFKLSLVDTCTDETVWSATIRDGTAVYARLPWQQSSKGVVCFPLRRLCGQHRKEAEEKACM